MRKEVKEGQSGKEKEEKEGWAGAFRFSFRKVVILILGQFAYFGVIRFTPSTAGVFEMSASVKHEQQAI